ncbi:MAG: NAD(P)/FAD-dependent oxidoreductase [Solirubrobacterales bacterium]
MIGASLAGCTTAILLARAGASVLLIDKQRDIDAYKVVCGHYIQSSALPTIERLGLLEPMLEAGAVYSPARIWFQDRGEDKVIGPVERDVVPPSINLPRRKLDPIIRKLAADTPGVELRLGTTLESLESLPAARLVVAADGRDSTFAKLSGMRTIRAKNGRFNYSPFYSGAQAPEYPATTSWFMGDQWAGAFPTSDGLTGYYLMPTHDRLPEFKEDLEGACLRMISELPGAPPVEELTLAGPIVGRVDMSFQWRNPVHRGAALVGDAAFSIDPLYGVGCGWALQSGELLADAVAPALVAGKPLNAPLRKYRRAVRSLIVPFSLQMLGYSRGRALSRSEKFILRRAARDPAVEQRFIQIVTRNISPLLLARPSEVLKLLRG